MKQLLYAAIHEREACASPLVPWPRRAKTRKSRDDFKLRWPAPFPLKDGCNNAPQGIPTRKVETLHLPLVVLTSSTPFVLSSDFVRAGGSGKHEMFFTGKAALKFIGSNRTTSRLLRLGLSQGVGHGRSVAAGIQNPPASSTFGTGIPRPPSVAGRGFIPALLGPFVMLGQRGKSTRTPYI